MRIMLPTIYMDESGKESDQYFIVGFLCVPDSNKMSVDLGVVRNKVRNLAREERQARINQLRADKDVEGLFKYAQSPSSFELKFGKIRPYNVALFQELIQTLVSGIDFRFDGLLINKADPAYRHTTHQDMYKRLVRLFFKYRCQGDCIFIPDTFDQNLDWNDIVADPKIKGLVPGDSHALLPLQVVDLLTGLIGLGFKDPTTYSNSDVARAPVLNTLKEELKLTFSEETITSPRYFSIWPVDFSKTFDSKVRRFFSQRNT